MASIRRKRKLVGVIAKKGGPSSGHWGHRGRPGVHGGSLPGSLSSSQPLNKAYFTKGPGREMLSGLWQYEKNQVIAMLGASSGIKANHVNGLSKISTRPPDGKKDDWLIGEEYRQSGIIESAIGTEAAGFYSSSSKSIHLNPESGKISSVLNHELGHHVHKSLPPANLDALSQMYSKLRYAIGVGDPVTAISWTKRNIDKASNFGYRPYSFSNFSEFVADTYKMAAQPRSLSAGTKDALQSVVNQVNLNNQQFPALGIRDDWTVDTLFDY